MFINEQNWNQSDETKRLWTAGASIPLPHACKACALPIELAAHSAVLPQIVDVSADETLFYKQLF